MTHWPDVTFRVAEPGDDAALRTLDRATWSTQVSPGTQAATAAPFFSERCVPGDVVVATNDGTILGFAILRQSEDMPSHSHVVQINGFMVEGVLRGEFKIDGHLVDDVLMAWLPDR